MRFRIYRSGPGNGAKPHYDAFEITPREKMSVLDALVEIQSEQDPTLSFRHSCRAGMCGSCAMNVNGVPRWTCRTPLVSLNAKTVTVEPLRYFPVVKDLAVDMQPFFGKSRMIVPHVVSRNEDDRMAIILPTEEGRAKIADNLECIGCGCCYASCGIPGLDPDYLGPHALNRAYTLVLDRRDAERETRLRIVDDEHGCWRCHTQTACMDVCPKEINTSEAVQALKREVLSFQRDASFVPEALAIPAEMRFEETPAPIPMLSRRDFLHVSAAGVIGVMAIAVGLPIAGAVISPAQKSESPGHWVELGALTEFPIGKMVEKRYQRSSASSWFDRAVAQTVYVLRGKDDTIRALSPECTHLGCPVRWVEASRTFLCPCHGGVFDESGKNTYGPPPKPLERIETRIENGKLYLRGVA